MEFEGETFECRLPRAATGGRGRTEGDEQVGPREEWHEGAGGGRGRDRRGDGGDSDTEGPDSDRGEGEDCGTGKMEFDVEEGGAEGSSYGGSEVSYAGTMEINGSDGEGERTGRGDGGWEGMEWGVGEEPGLERGKRTEAEDGAGARGETPAPEAPVPAPVPAAAAQVQDPAAAAALGLKSP